VFTGTSSCSFTWVQPVGLWQLVSTHMTQPQGSQWPLLQTPSPPLAHTTLQWTTTPGSGSTCPGAWTAHSP